jgi:hypothetical protein
MYNDPGKKQKENLLAQGSVTVELIEAYGKLLASRIPS